MRVLHLDTNHPLLLEQLNVLGFINDEDYTSGKDYIESVIDMYEGIVIRSRFKIDAPFIEKAKNLKFIARVGAGMENIDCEFAKTRGIALISAPEGNSNAVGEHSLALLLALFNNIIKANTEVKNGKWEREGNRGVELEGKTIGIIGYGNMGKAFARKLKGFQVNVLCYDIKDSVGDSNAIQVSLQKLFEEADVVSLHTPETEQTIGMINEEFIGKFKKPFWFINTARGKSVITKDLVQAIKQGKILGAGLDVLEYEKTSFESMFHGKDSLPEAFNYLTSSQNVILSPHIAGWTVESKSKLAQTIVDKIRERFC